MATRCPLCGKKSTMVTRRKLLRGNYNPTTRYRQYPNLQWAKIQTKQGLKRMKICTDCKKRMAYIRS